MPSPYAIIEYNLSQGQDEHTLTSDNLADLIEEVIDAVKEDRKNNTLVFTAKFKRLVEELRKT